MALYHSSRPGPSADVAVLAGRDQALLQKDQRRQPFVGNLFRHQGFNQGNLVDPRALDRAQPDRVSAAAGMTLFVRQGRAGPSSSSSSIGSGPGRGGLITVSAAAAVKEAAGLVGAAAGPLFVSAMAIPYVEGGQPMSQGHRGGGT